MKALPTQFVLHKVTKRRRFSLLHLITYIVIALLIIIIIYPFFNSYQSVFKNPEVYIYVLLTSIIFWFWDSYYSWFSAS
ncbi:uncharacterized protein UPF0715 [Scopulibacillus darangshiensis]|uniref:Uncharacterized protein UPF0715 n=1 Tax=Scopulibacillus darangshiensis TaxID=442528 RepID=A0A4R2P837_9BACL|nr:uncharacterized protein UPF0715 [Scopulibacillus darangshiensis]